MWYSFQVVPLVGSQGGGWRGVPSPRSPAYRVVVDQAAPVAGQAVLDDIRWSVVEERTLTANVRPCGPQQGCVGGWLPVSVLALHPNHPACASYMRTPLAVPHPAISFHADADVVRSRENTGMGTCASLFRCSNAPGPSPLGCSWHLETETGGSVEGIEGAQAPVTSTRVQLLDEIGTVVAEAEVPAASGGLCAFPGLHYGAAYKLQVCRSLGSIAGPPSAPIAAPYVQCRAGLE